MEYHELPSAIEKCASNVRKIDSVLKDLNASGQEYLPIRTEQGAIAFLPSAVIIPLLREEQTYLKARLDKMQGQHQTLTDVAVGLLKE